MPGLRARSPSKGHERGNHTLFLSLSFSLLPLCLKINKIFLKKNFKLINWLLSSFTWISWTWLIWMWPEVEPKRSYFSRDDIHTWTCKYINLYTYTCICVCIYIHTHMCIHIFPHTQWHLSIVINSLQSLWWVLQLMGIRRPHDSLKCDETWASAKGWTTVFSSKCSEYRVWRALKPTSTEVWLYMFSTPAMLWFMMIKKQSVFKAQLWSLSFHYCFVIVIVTICTIPFVLTLSFTGDLLPSSSISSAVLSALQNCTLWLWIQT